MASYMDLNLFVSDDNNNILKTCLELGYRTVAINDVVEFAVTKSKKKDKRVAPVEDEVKQIRPMVGSMNQLSRFSTVLSDMSQLSEFQKHEKLKLYDIVSVQPMTEKIFLNACSEMEIDIISFNLTERLPFLPKRSMVNCAIKRGISFEIIYSPMIEDSTARRNVISNANLLVDLSRGKNIIVSSGCKESLYLKSPYDVMNLCLLFGLNRKQALDVMTSNPRSVLLHAQARRMYKSVLHVHDPVEEDEE